MKMLQVWEGLIRLVRIATYNKSLVVLEPQARNLEKIETNRKGIASENAENSSLYREVLGSATSLVYAASLELCKSTGCGYSRPFGTVLLLRVVARRRLVTSRTVCIERKYRCTCVVLVFTSCPTLTKERFILCPRHTLLARAIARIFWSIGSMNLGRASHQITMQNLLSVYAFFRVCSVN